MTTDVNADAIIEQNGVLVGPYRAPRNLAQVQKGSIHDDATASKLGFRGGTVAGSIHMEQFPPILLRAFGQRWFETGSLSCYFRNATLDGERVRTLAQAPTTTSDAQINVWMERDDGLQVLEGTASVGDPSEPSLLRQKLAEPREPGEMRILSRVSVGQELPPVTSRVDRDDAREIADRLRVITEPLDWYTDSSPWGGPILNPGLLVHALVAAQTGIRSGPAVGLYGAIEVRHHNGPAFHDRDYVVDGKVLALGVTPKTEYVWFETMLRDRGGAPPVASMLMMLRFMKASSPLWAE